ncbi:MAG: helix-turn-helix transcriptional regulator [Trichormus sp. ATA11-4-KO1]|jgi:DNA-binding CsgD family transcriptional regulator|nr:helix-turn-helix transcriptional regulator [Trichormus sp. ATA11-4-KO1]
MTTLRQRDVRQIQHFLQELHTLCNLEILATRVISTLPQVVASDVVAWSPVNFPKNRISPFITSKNFDSPMLEDVERTAHDHFYEHPLARHYVVTNDGGAYKISDFLCEQELHRLEGLYHGFLRLIDAEEQMIMVLPIASASFSLHNSFTDIVIALHRPQRNFSERDRLVLNLLRPHLIQAYENAKVFSQMQQELTRLHQTMEQLGMITMSASGNVQVMTQKAWEMLTQYFSYSRTQGFNLPELLQHWVNYQISQSDNDHVTPFYPPLRIEQEHKCLIVRLICDRPQEQYLLMLEEQPLSSFSLQSLEMLGLTRREAEILFWGAKDKSTKEIASLLDCSDKTVEKHFEHIYEKLGVQTRIAAIMQALDKLGLINHRNPSL